MSRVTFAQITEDLYEIIRRIREGSENEAIQLAEAMIDGLSPRSKWKPKRRRP